MKHCCNVHALFVNLYAHPLSQIIIIFTVSSTRSSNDSHKMSRSKPTSAVVPSSTYVFQQTQQSQHQHPIVPPPRKKRRNQLRNVQHSCSSSFTYLPSTNYASSMRKREMKNNQIVKYQRRRKSLGLCICS